MNEPAFSYIESHVGHRSAHLLREAQDIAGLEGLGIEGHRRPVPHLLPAHPGKGDSELGVGILNESGTVESVGIGSTPPVGGTDGLESRLDNACRDL